MALHAKNIAEVIRLLDGIVADTAARGDPRGCFAAVYRQMTLAVQQGMKDGVFADKDRMDRIDTLFANRYFEAYEAVAPTRAWRVAFDAAEHDRLIVLQHLLLGINAHINLDLAVVVGENLSGSRLADFRADYDEINNTIAAVMPKARDTIESFSPLIKVLEPIDEVNPVLDFTFDRARETAWVWAEMLSQMDPRLRPAAIDVLDLNVATLGRVIARPDPLTSILVGLVYNTESKDMRRIISALNTL
ncbi:DUF5995 family protein [Rhodococcus sp. B50]|uniref:DUF5995 family protein n=1 Tax=Rhodococcus sp. B50 TaxID=2682847 RepID=UPI001BD2BE8B|nr:DUF5995 family protein [Rhodococcus sp. B50]MBS9375355.1 hypothetical protein [Rhodococcus sp. B50]